MTKLLCASCAHYMGEASCEAYPIRIPTEIMVGDNNHDKVQSDQIGEAVYQMSEEWKKALEKIPKEEL